MSTNSQLPESPLARSSGSTGGARQPGARSSSGRSSNAEGSPKPVHKLPLTDSQRQLSPQERQALAIERFKQLSPEEQQAVIARQRAKRAAAARAQAQQQALGARPGSAQAEAAAARAQAQARMAAMTPEQQQAARQQQQAAAKQRFDALTPAQQQAVLQQRAAQQQQAQQQQQQQQQLAQQMFGPLGDEYYYYYDYPYEDLYYYYDPDFIAPSIYDAAAIVRHLAVCELFVGVFALAANLAVPRILALWYMPFYVQSVLALAASAIGYKGCEYVSPFIAKAYLLWELFALCFKAAFLTYNVPPLVGDSFENINALLLAAHFLPLGMTLVVLLALASLLVHDWQTGYIPGLEPIYYDYYGAYYDYYDPYAYYYPYTYSDYDYPYYSYYEEADEEEEGSGSSSSSAAAPVAAAAKGGKGKEKKKKPQEAAAAAAVAAVGGDGDEDGPTITLLPKALGEPFFPDDLEGVCRGAADVWEKPMSKTAVYSDLTRLAKRINLWDNGRLVVDRSKWGDKKSNTAVLASLINEVAKRVEDKEQQKRIEKATKALAKVTISDSELGVRSAFEQGGVRTDSKTAYVFRPIHQGVVKAVSTWLRTRTRLLSKDVRESSGWLIDIRFYKAPPGEDEVTGRYVDVVHTRKEQSLVALEKSAKEHFEFSYEILFRMRPFAPFGTDLEKVRVEFKDIVPDPLATTTNYKSIRESLQVLLAWNRSLQAAADIRRSVATSGSAAPGGAAGAPKMADVAAAAAAPVEEEEEESEEYYEEESGEESEEESEEESDEGSEEESGSGEEEESGSGDYEYEYESEDE